MLNLTLSALIVAIIGGCGFLNGCSRVYTSNDREGKLVAGHPFLKAYSQGYDDEQKAFAISNLKPMFQGLDGLYWFGKTLGLYTYDEGANRWVVLSKGQESEFFEWVKDICEDSSGRIWVHSGLEPTVGYFDKKNGYTAGERMSPYLGNVSAMFGGLNGRVWFASKAGLVGYDGSQWTDVFRIPKRIRQMYGETKARHPHDLMSQSLKSPETLTSTEPRSERNERRNKASVSSNDIEIFCGLEDHGRRIWLAAEKGLLGFTENNADWQFYPFPEELIEGYTLYGDHRDRLWVADTYGHVAVYDKRTGAWISHNLIDVVSRQINKPSLTVFLIHGIYQDKEGQMMFATDRGLFVLSEHENRWEAYRNVDGGFAPTDVTINRKSNLDNVPRNNVTSIMEDRNGKIWIGTGKGVVVLDQ